MGKRVERTGDNIKYLIDTHAIYWFFFEINKLPLLVKNVLLAKNFIVSTINLAELSNLLEKKKISEKQVRIIWNFLEGKGIFVAAFDKEVFHEFMKQDKNLDIHDRIIVATAKLFKAQLVTRDKEIPKYYPKTIW